MDKIDRQLEIKKIIRKNTEDIDNLNKTKRQLDQNYFEAKRILNKEKELLQEINYYSEGSHAARSARLELEESDYTAKKLEKNVQEFSSLLDKSIRELNQENSEQEYALKSLERSTDND